MKQDPKQDGAMGVNDTLASQEIDSSLTHPSNLKPWEDRSLDAKQRFAAYNEFVARQLEAIKNAMLRVEGDDLKGREVQFAPDTVRWMEEARGLRSISAEDFCRRIDRPELRELLGKNFLGSEEWNGQGIEVGAYPPIPPCITSTLLESDCPLHPGEKIKDTHLLVLVPQTVNGEPYTPLKLDELCKGSGERLIDRDLSSWKSREWARTPQAQSEWVLLPKSDPDPKVSSHKHFRSKNIAAQQKVHDTHYTEYREAKSLEVMTMAVLHALTHKERLLTHYVRCEESNASGGRVCVGVFTVSGLKVVDHRNGRAYATLGRALARKL
jgi:hypothetical protein